MIQANSTQSAKICPNLHFGGWCGPDKLKPRVPRSVQICILGEGCSSRPTQPKVLRSVQICILGGGGVIQTNSTQSAKICANLHFGGWCGPDKLKPKVPRSVQICMGGGPDQLNLEYLDLSKICIWVGWWEWGLGGGFGPDQLNQKCQDLSKSAFEGAVWSRPTQPKMLRSVQICILGGGGVIQANSTQSAKICPNLHFGGWCGPDKLKPKVPRSVQICMWGGGGGAHPDQLNPKC